MSVEYQCRLRPWLWPRCVAQVPLPRGQIFGVDAIWEQRGGLLLSHAGRDHHAVSGLEEEETRLFYTAAGHFLSLSSLQVAFKCVTHLPVGGRGHSSPCCDLERVHHSQDLVEVASGGGRVEDGQFELFVRADDEHLHTETQRGLVSTLYRPESRRHS